jgi:hypothetical protein
LILHEFPVDAQLRAVIAAPPDWVEQSE